MFIKLVMDGVAGVKFLSEGGFKHCWAVVQAHFAFYGQFGRYRKVRKRMAATMSNDALPHVYQRGIVWQVFGRGKRKFSELSETDFSR